MRPMLKFFRSKRKPARPRILIADDEPDLLSTIQCQLRWCRYDVTTAANGLETIEKARREKPDLILLDVNMPVMNGHQVLERLRANPDLASIPVIMVTAMYEPKDIAAVSAYGVADYVTKPFDFSELTEKISNALDGGATG